MNHEVEILGKRYAIRSDAGDAFLHETAGLVNTKMREVVGRFGALSSEKIAVLTAMNLAGELLKNRRDQEGLRSTLEKKAKKLLQLIDSHL